MAEVCVLGAGPAGCVFAARMAQLGHDVQLIEREPFPRRRLGESLSPGVMPMLQSAGLHEGVEAAGFPRIRAVWVKWGEPPRLRDDPREQGLLVDRGEFDLRLLASARSLGVRVHQPARVLDCALDGSRWRISFEAEGRREALDVDFLADARGRRGRAGPRQSRTGAPTLAVYAYWRGSGSPRTPRIEAGRDAWYWGVPLSDGLYNTLVFVDPKRFRSAPGMSASERFLELLGLSSLLEDRRNCELAGPVRAIDATPYLEPECATPRSIRVGDAAVAIDPISSSGVQKAIQSALSGAVVANTLIRKPERADAAVCFHHARLAETSERHRRWAAGHYRGGGRSKTTTRSGPTVPRVSSAAAASPKPALDAGAIAAEPLELSPKLDFVRMSRLEGEFVSLGWALRHPGLASPVVYLNGLELAPLVRRAPPGSTPMQIAQSWSNRRADRVGLGNRGLVVQSWRFGRIVEPERSAVILTGSVSEWLEANGLGRFAALFADNEVDLTTLRLLTENDLKEIGLPFGPRKRISSLINDERRLERSGSAEASVRAPVGERRQLTALFCDMVGFTDLAQRLDLEALQVVVRAYEDTCTNCIVRYDGYVFTLLGDGVVAFFGFPLAHEGEAERAIRAGLDIVDAMARLRFPDVGRIQVRIGIATGMVVVATGESNAVGQTMNLASRLQAAAQPGMVVVGERTQRLAGGQFEYEDLGERELKGVSGLTRLYRVLGLSTVESRFEASTQRGLMSTVGREEEIGVLHDLWRQVHGTQSGRAVLVSGDAGIGKSRIVSALRERLGKQPVHTLLFQCSPFFVNSAFYPVRSWFERTLRLDRNEDAASRLAKLEKFFLKRRGLPAADLPFVAAMLSIPFHERYGAISIAPKLAKEATMRVLVEIIRAEARAEPILILIEDAHWADPTTLDWLRRLTDRLADATAFLVMTARPEFVSVWNGSPDIVTIDLGKLSASQSALLVEELLDGKTLPPGLADQIVARADGVPLFVQELTKTILESGDLVVEGDRYVYAGSSAAITIPETLRDSLMARLDRVPESKEVAQIGSVIGREFSYELISGLELIGEDKLEKPLRLLTASGLATSHGEIPDSMYTFSHALVQDAAYDSLLKTRRKQLHGDVARLLQERWRDTRESAPELLAHHYTEAEHYDLAAPLWLKAGEIAIQRFALPEAISHLRAGMAATSKLPPSRDRDHMETRAQIGAGSGARRPTGLGQRRGQPNARTGLETRRAAPPTIRLPADPERPVVALYVHRPIDRVPFAGPTRF